MGIQKVGVIGSLYTGGSESRSDMPIRSIEITAMIRLKVLNRVMKLGDPEPIMDGRFSLATVIKC
jgi:hypothetical protein